MTSLITRWAERGGWWLIYLGVMGMSAFLTLNILHRSLDDVETPSLIGLSIDEARKIADHRDLKVAVSHQDHSADVPAGHLIRQTPSPGQLVRTGTRVSVTESLGPRIGDTPNLVGVNLREAQERLESSEIADRLSFSYSDTAPIDTIMAQIPAAGEPVSADDGVRLLVSLGPEPPWLLMPELTGMDLATALASLRHLGLTLSRLDKQPSPDVSDSILAQSPPAGAKIASTGLVSLTVSADIDLSFRLDWHQIRFSEFHGFLKRHLVAIAETPYGEWTLVDDWAKPKFEKWVLIPRGYRVYRSIDGNRLLPKVLIQVGP